MKVLDHKRVEGQDWYRLDDGRVVRDYAGEVREYTTGERPEDALEIGSAIRAYTVRNMPNPWAASDEACVVCGVPSLGCTAGPLGMEPVPWCGEAPCYFAANEIAANAVEPMVADFPATCETCDGEGRILSPMTHDNLPTEGDVIDCPDCTTRIPADIGQEEKP